MTIIAIVLFIILFGRISALTRMVTKLSDELDAIRSNRNYSQTTVPVAPQRIPNVYETGIVQSPDVESLTKQLYVTKNDQAEENDILKWLGENTMLKLGVGLVLLGFGWFVSYAFIHNWIGPVGRISLGFLTGAIVAMLGTWRLSKDTTQGVTLTILGTALVTITAIAGQSIYHFYPEFVVLVIIFMVSVFTSLSAVAWSIEKLVTYGVLLSLLAPILSHGPSISPALLYSYLLLVSLGSIWVSIIKKWKSPMLVGMLGFFLYSLAHFIPGATKEEYKFVVLSLSYLTSLLYLFVGIWSLISHSEEAKSEEMFLTLLNTGTILGVTIGIIEPVYQSMVLALWMLVYAFSGYYIFMVTKKEKLIYLHAIFSILFLGVATSIELSGATLVIAFAIESAIITFASYLVTEKYDNAKILSLTVLIPVVMSITSFMSSKWQSGIIHSDMFVLLVVGVVLYSVGYLLRKIDRGGEVDIEIAYLIASSVYLYGIIWLSAHYLFDKDTATFFSLFIYTIIGLFAHFSGIIKQKNILRNYGTALLTCVILRLLFVEVWNMDIVLRVITFLVIGAMFISTAFMSKKYRTQ